MPVSRVNVPARVLKACLALALLVLAVCLPAGSAYAQGGRGDWWMEGHDAQHTGRSNAVGPDRPVQKWAVWLTEFVDSGLAIGSDGTLYTGTVEDYGGRVWAINPDGSTRWGFRTVGAAQGSPAIGSDGTIYVGCSDDWSDGGRLYAVNPNGTERWSVGVDYGYPPSSPAIGSDGIVYYADGNLHAINPSGSEAWSFETDDDALCYSPAIGFDGTLYASSTDGTIYAVNPDGSENWQFDLGEDVDLSPVIGPDGTLYVASVDGSLFAIGPGGSLNWEFSTEDRIWSAPVISSDGTVYVGAGYGALYAVNADGSEKWRFDVGDSTGPLAIDADGAVYFGTTCNDGRFYAVNPDGSRKWMFTPAGYTEPSEYVPPSLNWYAADGPPAIGGDGTIYVGSTEGTLYAIGPGETLAAPYVSISQPSCRVTGAGPVTYTLSYTNASAISLAKGDVRLNRTGTANGTITVSRIDSANTRCVTVSNITGNGTLGISIEAGTARNSTGEAPAGTSGFFGVDNSLSGPGDWSMLGHDARHTGRSAFVGPESPVEKWRIESDWCLGGSVAIDSNGAIYYGSEDGKLHAVNPDGSEKWTFEAQPGFCTCPAVGLDGTIYAASRDGVLYAISPNGFKRWEFATDCDDYCRYYASSPVVGPDGTVYLGSVVGVYAVRPNGVAKWLFETPDRVYEPPAIGSDGTLYLSVGYSLCAVGANGRRKWEVPMECWISPALSIGSDGTVYAGSQDYNLYAFGPDGSVRWKFETGDYVEAAPAIGPSGTVYAASWDGNLYAIGSDGSKKWSSEVGQSSGSPLAIDADGVAYFGSEDGKIHAINPDGSMKWEFATEDAFYCATPAIGSDGTLYMCSDTGTLYAIGSAPSGLPPTVSVSAPSATSARSGPVSYMVNCRDATSISLTPATITLNKTGTANGTISVTGSGNFSRTVTISKITGEGTLGISIGAGTASNVMGESEAAGPSETFSVVKTRPSATISAPSVSATTGGPVDYAVTYSNAASVTLSADDVKLIKSGTANGIVSVAGTGNATRTVTISGITGDGWLRISLAAGTASNIIGSAPATGKSAAIEAVNTLPTIAVGAPSKLSTKSGPVSYDVSYSHAASVGLTSDDVQLVSTGTADGIVTVTGTGTTKRKVTISGITGDGSLGISIDGGTASNIAGGALASGPSTAFAVVNTPPRVVIMAPSVGSTRNGPVSFEIAYTGATAVSLSTARVHLMKTGTASGKISVSGKGLASRTVTISNIKGQGTLAISIDAKSASNPGGYAPSTGRSVTVAVGAPD